MRKNFSIGGMSQKGMQCLPDVLDEMGYAGRYNIDPAWLTLSIDSTSPIIRKAMEEAENRVHEEKGYMMMVRVASYSQVWVPESKAATVEDARKAAIEMADDNWLPQSDEWSTMSLGTSNWVDD